ncbi:MAG TPA: MASE1 domain-containing protein [Candidatus Acidoferrum sp.]|nr:MASE1 domain-containing protein [Candidatus Acidoferrum sp.]
MASAVRFARLPALATIDRGAWAHFALTGLGILAAYLLLDFLSYVRWFGPSGIAPWNPAIGMSLALLILADWRYALWLFPAAVLSEALIRHGIEGWVPRLAVAAAVTAVYGGGAVVFGRLLRGDPRLERLRDLVALFVTAAGASAAMACAEAGLLVFFGEAEGAAAWLSLIRLWVGDMIGIAVITPLILRLATSFARGRDRDPERIPAEGPLVGIGILICACTWIVFGLESTDEFKWFYLMFLPVVAAALRYGLNGACLALAVAQLAVILTMQWRNYAAWSLMEFQLLMLILTLTGLLTGVVVSERFRAEAAFRRSEMRLREKQAELVHVSRLKLLGEMGTAVAHELNQPITAARAYVRAGERLATAGGSAAQPAIDALLQAITQLDLAGSILNRIRGMLSQGVRRSEVIELRAAIEEAVALARFEATRARVRIVTDFGSAPVTVTSDPIQVEQVLLNLFRNSFDALARIEGEERIVHVGVETAAEGSQVEVSVRDNGPGIPADVADSLFKPFNTTKPEGLGLGLVLCRSLVESWGGRLWLARTGPSGTEFRFSWPCHAVAQSQRA